MIHLCKTVRTSIDVIRHERVNCWYSLLRLETLKASPLLRQLIFTTFYIKVLTLFRHFIKLAPRTGFYYARMKINRTKISCFLHQPSCNMTGFVTWSSSRAMTGLVIFVFTVLDCVLQNCSQQIVP